MFNKALNQKFINNTFTKIQTKVKAIKIRSTAFNNCVYRQTNTI